MKRTRPSVRWSSEHGQKIAHRTRFGAVVHCVRLMIHFRRGFTVYRCRWGARYRDGEAAPAHWHAGSTRNRPKNSFHVIRTIDQ